MPRAMSGQTSLGFSGLYTNFRFVNGAYDGNQTYADFRFNPASQNLLISAATGGGLYLNYDHGTGGIFFGNGLSQTMASMSAAGVLTATGGIFTGPVKFMNYTVGTLPAGQQFQRAFVTDALTPVFGSAVVGGGAVTVPVYYTGSAWFVG